MVRPREESHREAKWWGPPRSLCCGAVCDEAVQICFVSMMWVHKNVFKRLLLSRLPTLVRA
eukprot:3105074-Rhodomonas_salina.1